MEERANSFLSWCLHSSMDNLPQSGALSETVVNGGSLDDSTIALTSMNDGEYAQKRAAFLTRTQTLLSKFSAAGGGSIFVAAEVHKQAEERAIQKQREDKEYAMLQGTTGADSPSLFPGEASYLDKNIYKAEGGQANTDKPWESPFEDSTHCHFVGANISRLAEMFKIQNRDNGFISHHTKDFISELDVGFESSYDKAEERRQEEIRETENEREI